MFISFLYMFRATMCPSSGEITGMHTRQSSVQSDKYQVSHRYSYFSWWWARSRPKHIEKRNKHTKKNCAPSWLYLQCLEDLLIVWTIIGQTRYPCPVKCNYSRLKWTILSRPGPGTKNNSGHRPLLWDLKAGWHRLNYRIFSNLIRNLFTVSEG